ncbi:GNAT family N-acetyltransferase [Pseudoalteromonas denitrificans]|uniref:Acetyltransferase (GNAT) domain-containing protein n=1 Tax=Pseudoalteromonas denitrificans DSM 6059 TaxID=1123010 RepID=A0A1I1E804_9GAMM|nr:GNAT family N-acetyltransferase [Pseudoalteromonas denitrificans]SFB81100.1 Acetyltransferase (GNAT) domain-containing protein [Pseudoalteromonas denitrificans DSM 6059]
MAIKIKHTLNAQDFSAVFRFLSERSYWSKGISKKCLRFACDNSLCFVLTENNTLRAFARVVTDQATFANLLDVFVLEEYRGLSYGKQLITAVMTDARLQGLRRFTLATKDAHDLYQKYDFSEPVFPEGMMEIYKPNIYIE